MSRSRKAFCAMLLMASTSFNPAHSADPIEELKTCARMTDREARFACIDNLGQRVLQEESAEERPTREEAAQPEAVTTAPETKVQPPPDDLGVAKFGDDQESKSIKYSGMVTSCEKGHHGDWYFTFDNGQVWKEVVDRDLRFKECNFSVTIMKDFIGYKMKVEAFERPIRVKRYQ